MHAKYIYEVSISYGFKKVIAKVKVDNRQTNRQTDKQDKNTIPRSRKSRDIRRSRLCSVHLKEFRPTNGGDEDQCPFSSEKRVLD